MKKRERERGSRDRTWILSIQNETTLQFSTHRNIDSQPFFRCCAHEKCRGEDKKYTLSHTIALGTENKRRWVEKLLVRHMVRC